MRHSKQNILPLIATLGVVYGDIGTSPLYAIRECFSGNIGLNEANVLGVLSLIFWALMIVVTLKYVLLILRAHNNGEGGILALTALISNRRLKFISTSTLIATGLLGAALFFGDTIITPAISVLSALEGITVSFPKLQQYIMPASIVIIILLFLLQSKGTDTVGSLFGPIMLTWFLVIGILGLWQICNMPHIIKAISPWYGIKLAITHPKEILPLLGFVVLCITGAEALYADMGHFGARAIRISWLSLVFPCLVLNYFGQGVAILQYPEAIEGTSVFLSKDCDHMPLSIIKYLEHSNCLSEQVVILTILSHTIPRIPKGERIFVQHFANGFVQVIAHHGFMQSPRISTILKGAHTKGLDIDVNHVSFFLLSVIPVLGARLNGLRGLGARIFRLLLRNTTKPAKFFEIPYQKVVELGVQFKIADY